VIEKDGAIKKVIFPLGHHDPYENLVTHYERIAGMIFSVTVPFWKTHHAVHVSFARPVSFGHLPEAHSIMNCISLPETEPLLFSLLTFESQVCYNLNLHGRRLNKQDRFFKMVDIKKF
jgi:hypothetical protein